MLKIIIFIILEFISYCATLENPITNLSIIEVNKGIQEIEIIPSQTKRMINYQDTNSTIGMSVISSNQSLLNCEVFDKSILFDPYTKNEIEILQFSTKSTYTDQSLKINRTINVNDPEFIINNPILVGLANTTQGLILVSSNHIITILNLTFSLETNLFQIKSNTSYNFSNERPQHYEEIQPQIVWSENKSTLFILFPQQIISAKLNNKVMNFITNKILVQNELELIGQSKIQNDQIYLCRGTKGIEIYNIEDDGKLNLVKSLLDQLLQFNKSLNVIDFCFGGIENNLLFILDKYQGLSIFNFDFKEMIITKWLDETIKIDGTKLIKIHKNIVMIMLEDNSYNQIIEYSIQYQENKLFYMKTHYLDGKYFDIDIEDQFAVVRGNDGHKIIYHSIHEGFQLSFNKPITEESWMDDTFESYDLDQYLIVPQMRAFYLTQYLNESFVVSISSRKLIFVRFLRIDPYVECTLSNKAEIGSEYQVQATLNSTGCLEKQNQEKMIQDQKLTNLIMCKKETLFKIKVKNGLAEEVTSYYLYVILVILSLFLLCSLLIAIRIFFARQSSQQALLQGVIQNLGNKGYVVDKSQDSVSGF